MIPVSAARFRKALMAAAAGASEALALGLLGGTPEKITLVVLAMLGVYGVYRVPNRRP